MSTVDIPSDKPDRVGKIDVLVTYRAGPYISGMVRVPKETFTEENMKAAVKADAEPKLKYQGFKFTI